MKRSLYLLLSLCVLISACRHEEETVPNRTIFTFTATNAQMISETDYWVVLHNNSNGHYIDAKQFINNETLVFESTQAISNNMIDVTIFTGGTNSTTGPVVGQVYTNVALGSTWVWPQQFPYTVPDTGGIIGEYTLTITGIPSLVSFDASDAFGDVNYGHYNLSSGTLTATCNLNAKGNDLLLSIDTGTGKPKYAMITDLGVGKSFTLDYSTFKDFDKYLTITLPETKSVISTVIGYPEGVPMNWRSYTMQHYINGPNPIRKNEINIGLLNSLPVYSFDVYVHPGGFAYVSYGPAPASIEFVDPGLFESSGTTLDDYTVTSSPGFDYRETNFRYDEGKRYISFQYYVPEGSTSKHHDPISPELGSKYGVDTGKARYIGSEFNKGRSYDIFLKSNFDPSFDQLTPYQETRVYRMAEE